MDTSRSSVAAVNFKLRKTHVTIIRNSLVSFNIFPCLTISVWIFKKICHQDMPRDIYNSGCMRTGELIKVALALKFILNKFFMSTSWDFPRNRFTYPLCNGIYIRALIFTAMIVYALQILSSRIIYLIFHNLPWWLYAESISSERKRLCRRHADNLPSKYCLFVNKF